jgi:LexA-binding, inner membrane-associated putative hydrolase
VPSPIAHGIAGAVTGWLIDPQPARVSGRLVLYAALGMAADLDLLVGAHSGPTHGLGAAMIVGVATWIVLQLRGASSDVRTACASAIAYASHTLLDWLGTDSSPPIGIMALWPFSRGYYESSWHVFLAISRRYWLPEFWTFNLYALARELLILVPIALVLLLVRRRSTAPNAA